MKIVNANISSPSEFYGLACKPAFSGVATGDIPFGSAICTVRPGTSSVMHRHHENERFYICDGSGEIHCNGAIFPVAKGDIVEIDPFDNHAIANSGSDDIVFMSVWWDSAAPDAPNETTPGTADCSGEVDGASTPTLIFTAPPTPNGDLHLGHLSGPYSGADIYCRHLRLTGQTALHACGRDDNQTYVFKKAYDEARAPADLADDYAARITGTLSMAGIAVDHFEDPNRSRVHNLLTQELMQRLFSLGYVFPKLERALYCVETGRYLYEAHVRGDCPHCGAESDGNACEQCGRPNQVFDLVNPRSKYGSGEVEERLVERLYFRLSGFADQLRDFHAQAVMPAHLRSLCNIMLGEGLPDICVSHPGDWGIPVNIAGFESHRTYVWFEMAAGYLASAATLEERVSSVGSNKWKRLMGAGSGNYVHFFGFDNGYFHALLIPAIYMASQWQVALPKGFVVNELLDLDGKKFSTSRGHLIWARDLLQRVPSDYVRFYLASIRPETAKENFTMTAFEDVIDNELGGRWRDVLTSVVALVADSFAGTIPEPGAWGTEHVAYYAQVTQLYASARRAYDLENFSPQRACALACSLLRESKRFLDSQVHYRGAPGSNDLLRTGTALLCLGLPALSVMIAPIMPNSTEAIWKLLGTDDPLRWVEKLSMHGGRIDRQIKVESIFPKVQHLPLPARSANIATEAEASV